jgi:hypothetical protein
VVGRDHRGGLDVVLYEVLGPGRVRIASQNIDWTGAPRPVFAQSCTGLQSAKSFFEAPACITS